MSDVTCPRCGAVNPDGANFCEACGCKLIVESAPAPEPAPTPEPEPMPEPEPIPTPTPEQKPAQTAEKDKTIDRENKPASFWAFLGLILLFNLPSLGFIASVIFSFAPENKNIKSFSRAWMTVKIAVFVIVLALSIALLCIVGSFISSFGSIFKGDSFDSLLSNVLESEYFAKLVDDTVGEMSVDEIVNLIGRDSVDEIISKANETMSTDVTFDELLESVREMTGKDSPSVNEILTYFGDDMGNDISSLSEFLKSVLDTAEGSDNMPFPRAIPSTQE